MARISQGRTIREFILGCLFILMLLLFFGLPPWRQRGTYGINGNYGLIEAVKADYGSAIFKLIEYYPLTKPLTLVIVVMIYVVVCHLSDWQAL